MGIFANSLSSGQVHPISFLVFHLYATLRSFALGPPIGFDGSNHPVCCDELPESL